MDEDYNFWYSRIMVDSMKTLLIIASALDAGFGGYAFQQGHYGWGMYMSSLAALAWIAASNYKEKTDDAS